MLRILKAPLRRSYAFLFPNAWKRRTELRYWKDRYTAEQGVLRNAHYEAIYTGVFGLDRADFAGKRVLDIGCGPRGSLEWADGAAQRVGLDPLVPDYLRLGADRHAMQYAAAPSERIPFPDGQFDIVACINALDHVDDLERTIAEIKRVTKPGGWFMLSVEIDHPPTDAEPITVDDAGLAKLEPEFEPVLSFRVGTPPDHDLHHAVRTRAPSYVPGQPGIHVARYQRR